MGSIFCPVCKEGASRAAWQGAAVITPGACPKCGCSPAERRRASGNEYPGEEFSQLERVDRLEGSFLSATTTAPPPRLVRPLRLAHASADPFDGATPDEREGIKWWNALELSARGYWLDRAGGDATPAEAYARFLDPPVSEVLAEIRKQIRTLERLLSELQRAAAFPVDEAHAEKDAHDKAKLEGCVSAYTDTLYKLRKLERLAVRS